MLRSFFVLMAVFLTGTMLKAQTKEEKNALDKKVIAEIVKPAQEQASQNNQAPDWDSLRKVISGKYNATEADRAITKAKIYASYGRDWPTFTAAIVHYTDAYEDKEDLNLMNKNANFILQQSNSADEVERAIAWMKHAVDKEPSSDDYKQTYQGLQAKLKGL
jgi:hypothetical protein